MATVRPLLPTNVREELETGRGSKTAVGCGHGWLAVLLLTFILFEIITYRQEVNVGVPVQDTKVDSSTTSINVAVPHNTIYQLVSAQKLTTSTNITSMIMNPSIMYKEFGMVSPPILVLSTKAFFNFLAQQAFQLGGPLISGSTIKECLDRPAQFGKLSIGFQVVGQLSAIYSYVAISQLTQPWEGKEHVEALALLVSQHSSSVAIVVGLSNNLVLPSLVATKWESRIAKLLSITGLVVGLPLWTSLAIAGFPYNFLNICLVFASGVFLLKTDNQTSVRTVLRMLLMGEEKGQAGPWTVCMFFGALVLSLVWLAMGVWTYPMYSFLNFGAFVFELVLPWFLLGMVLISGFGISNEGSGYAAFLSFSCGLVMVYLYSMIIPAGILTAHGHFTDAAALVFWGKKIKPYFTCTFKFPAEAAATTRAFATKYSHVVAVWLSEVFGLPA